MIRIGRDTYQLSTGRIVHARYGVIGLGDEREFNQPETLPRFQVGHGLAGHLYVQGEQPEHPWTRAERRELADYMIAMWTEFRDADGSA